MPFGRIGQEILEISKTLAWSRGLLQGLHFHATISKLLELQGPKMGFDWGPLLRLVTLGILFNTLLLIKPQKP